MLLGDEYSVRAFIEKAKQMGRGELIIFSHNEFRALQNLRLTPSNPLWGQKSRVEHYIHFVGEFCFLISQLARPAGMTDEEFQSTKEVIEPLVTRNEIKRDVLSLCR